MGRCLPYDRNFQTRHIRRILSYIAYDRTYRMHQIFVNTARWFFGCKVRETAIGLSACERSTTRAASVFVSIRSRRKSWQARGRPRIKNRKGREYADYANSIA
jgi:hypothetical protein